MGNKLDLKETDYLKYLIQDPQTEIIGLYLESLEDGRELMELARSTTKPIILHKANIGEGSRQIAKLHTAALANDDKIVDAALKQADVVRTKDFRSFANAVKILSLPPMKGNNLVIISRSGGIAIVAADLAEIHGFRLFPLSEAFQERVHDFFRAKVIRPTNPLDLGDLFDFDLYVKILEEALKIKEVDGIIFYHGATGEEKEPSRKLIKAVKEYSFGYQKPVALWYMTEEAELASIKRTTDYPIFTEPEDTLAALAVSRDHYRKLNVMKEKPPLFPVDRQQVGLLLQKSKEELRDPLLPEALEILKAYGIQVADYQWVTRSEDIEHIFKKMAGPFALKVVSPGISHKSDMGGVVLDVGTQSKAEEVYRNFKDLSGVGFSGVLIQKMVPAGKEVILGAKKDPSFGPVILFGPGGIYVEVFRESAIRVAPINRFDAAEMVSELKAATILKGARGERPSDIQAVIENLLRLSQLVTDFPEIEGIDINPVKVLEKGALAVDARIILSKGTEA
jgi:acetyltransferase